MRLLLLVLSALFILNSCSTDLDVNADYKETPIIFALINQNDSINYVRLQRSFSNENSSALEIARNFDSLFYDTTRVKLSLIEVRGAGDGTIDSTEVDVLVPEYNTNKADGIFGPTNGAQYVYKTDFANWRTDGSQYIFKFENFETKLVATAKTDVVECASISNPVSYRCDEIAFGNALNRNIDYNFNLKQNSEVSFFEFQGPKNAAYFSCEAEVEFIQEYEEDSRQNDTINTGNISRWQMLTLDLDENNLRKYGESELLSVGRKNLGNYLQRVIDVSNDDSEGVLKRSLLNIRFYFYYYNASYENYLEVNGNFNPLSQTKPLYTNVVNGLGLVASRNVLVSPKLKLQDPSNFSEESAGFYFEEWPQLKFPFLER
jgi:hypothetical protein